MMMEAPFIKHWEDKDLEITIVSYQKPASEVDVAAISRTFEHRSRDITLEKVGQLILSFNQAWSPDTARKPEKVQTTARRMIPDLKRRTYTGRECAQPILLSI